MLETLQRLTSQLQEETAEMIVETDTIEEQLSRAGEGRVEAGKTDFPGVAITIKGAVRRLQEEIHKAIFVKDGPDVVLAGEIAQASDI